MAGVALVVAEEYSFGIDHTVLRLIDATYKLI
jgi:hypothetical protein